MKLRTLIIDDEKSARSRLQKLLGAHPEIEIVGEAEDGTIAVSAILEKQPDLIFLDVQMPELNGFEVLRAIPASVRFPLVILATAHDTYAMEAFNANAVSYLLKPVNRDRLQLAVQRAIQLSQDKTQALEEAERMLKMIHQETPALKQIVGRRKDRFVLLQPDDVYFVFVESNNVKVKATSGLFDADYRMNDLETRLPNPPFFRARRSYIVNLQKVKEIAPFFKSTYLLIMSDAEGTRIQVSERQSKKLREFLQDGKS